MKDISIESHLADCRYMLNSFEHGSQQFLYEEYVKIVQVSTGLFQAAPSSETEKIFFEFKTVLAQTMKQYPQFRSGFRSEYFSLSNKNRNASLELILNANT